MDQQFYIARKLVIVLDIMTDHEELVADIANVEKMSIADRLKLAKKLRDKQLKNYAQYEKQHSKDKDRGKDKDRKANKSTNRTAPQVTAQLRFADSILLLDAAAKNDLVEGKSIIFSVWELVKSLQFAVCPQCTVILLGRQLQYIIILIVAGRCDDDKCYYLASDVYWLLVEARVPYWNDEKT